MITIFIDPHLTYIPAPCRYLLVKGLQYLTKPFNTLGYPGWSGIGKVQPEGIRSATIDIEGDTRQ